MFTSLTTFGNDFTLMALLPSALSKHTFTRLDDLKELQVNRYISDLHSQQTGFTPSLSPLRLDEEP